MTEIQKRRLEEAFEQADEFIMENTSCATLADIDAGFSRMWAQEVKRRAPFVEVRRSHGHSFVYCDGIAFTSDTAVGGFEPPKEEFALSV